jgi:sulfopyruvate decarboxylase subunit alpha
MPVSAKNSQVVYEALKASGVRLCSALPETWLVHLIRMADEDPDMTLVRLAKEEEGVGISAGAHFAGVRSAMLLQNHGFLQAINGITSLALLYKIPLLMLISDRGSLGERDSWQTEGGKFTRRVLDALTIQYDGLSRPDEVQPKVAKAMALAHSSLSPVALLLNRDLMWEDPVTV